MKYTDTVAGWSADELLAGTEFPTEIFNVSLSSGASISRGDLLCSSSMSGVFSIAGASDATKILCIAAEDFTADSLHAVTQAYFSGKFNRNKLTFGGNSSVDLSDFEQEMRKQNLHLTKMQET